MHSQAKVRRKKGSNPIVGFFKTIGRLIPGQNLQAFVLFLCSFGFLLAFWEIGSINGWFSDLMPSASLTIKDFWGWISDPFYDYGPNDKGIAWHLLVSLRRVAIGFTVGSLIAVPLGFLVGLSEVTSKAIDPYVQLLKPVSPLAWLPIGLGILKDSEMTAIFVIAITSIWPTLINTKFGVNNVDQDYLNVARTLGASPWRKITKVILPAAAPSIVSGLRISISISWLVIVAAEILVGGTGLGYFVWNEWNNLSITSIITAIVVIGLVGIILDRIFGLLQRFVSFGR
ncbi:nitrate ABC transporter, inner membrane subunit [Thalassoporum mexicanum PCC 7367]|uniref:nitrate ABC transporter permease n=1 Tax=Thalassoporum mexicanum TaxID=3457544 RepID=UPI00029FD09D|nr:nitrate ABC transporter permease [Pseudanabaena sp. PCC 7367]AFY70002.1 nitrate ABC transporter, inner membrane subunit [Pseudanabaena sp. PCC 7367]